MYMDRTVLCQLLSIDIDECASSPCDHNCTNFEGGFICLCDVGYRLNQNQQSCDGMYVCMYVCICAEFIQKIICESDIYSIKYIVVYMILNGRIQGL